MDKDSVRTKTSKEWFWFSLPGMPEKEISRQVILFYKSITEVKIKLQQQ